MMVVSWLLPPNQSMASAHGMSPPIFREGLRSSFKPSRKWPDMHPQDVCFPGVSKSPQVDKPSYPSHSVRGCTFAELGTLSMLGSSKMAPWEDNWESGSGHSGYGPGLRSQTD